MIGFELTLADGTTTQGVIFHDETVYIADPIADSYASQQDMLESLSGAKMAIIGAVMPLDLARQFVEEHYTKNMESLERTRKTIQDEHDIYVAYLDKYAEAS
jgi:hypothetical protein